MRADRREFCATIKLFARQFLSEDQMRKFDPDRVADAVEELGYTDLRDALFGDVEAVIKKIYGCKEVKDEGE